MKKLIINIIIAVFMMMALCQLSSNTAIAASADDGKQTIEDGTYIIRSKLNTKFVLDVLGASNDDGANVQIYEYSDVPQKKYKVTYIGDGYYTIIASHSNKSLDVKSASKEKGANVWQYESNDTDAQKWVIKDAGNGYYSIISKCNNLYVDVLDARAQNFQNIQMCDGNGLDAQKFYFEKVEEEKPINRQTIEDGKYVIRSAINENFALDVSGGSNDNGANIQLWQYSEVANQQFNIKYLGDGYYKILASHSDKSIDVKDASKAKGANVQQCEQNKEDAQKWIIKDVGNGYYSIISKCNGLYIDVYNAVAANGTNIQMCDGNGLNAQKFKFEKVKEIEIPEGKKTIEDGVYSIKTAINKSYSIDIEKGSIKDGANAQLYKYTGGIRQQFNITYLNNGAYKITAIHSKKVLDVKSASKEKGANIWQYESNDSLAQQWIIKDNGDGTYSIISKCNGLYVDVYNAVAANGTNIQMCDGNGLNAQKFYIEKTNLVTTFDESKYPGYKESIEKLAKEHPNWNFVYLKTNLKFNDAVKGEAEVHSRNLVEISHSGEWICSVCGTKLYDSGWYCASEKAIAYYLDPRNFLDGINIFQFEDVNVYLDEACTLDGIKSKVDGSFLQNYANDIENASRNTNVNPYYIISRLFQEQGKNGTTIGKGMDGGDGKTYYNPFNIGANGNGWNAIYANALARAKKEGWDSMQKAIEGGIYFCKVNWLENYQNTLYQNRWDIDSTNGSALYTHQYMQNLMGAYSEAKTLYSMYNNTGKINSKFTFIIPLYEEMDSSISSLPSDNTEAYPINVEIVGTNVRLRKEANTNSEIIKEFENAGEILLSVERGINSDWQKVVLKDGTVGYISGTYLKQVEDVTTTKYTAKVKTNDGNGCNTRIGPGLSLSKLTALADGEEVTVIDNTTYKNIDGYDWFRVIIPDGRQAFIPGKYLN